MNIFDLIFISLTATLMIVGFIAGSKRPLRIILSLVASVLIGCLGANHVVNLISKFNWYTALTSESLSLSTLNCIAFIIVAIPTTLLCNLILNIFLRLVFTSMSFAKPLSRAVGLVSGALLSVFSLCTFYVLQNNMMFLQNTTINNLVSGSIFLDLIVKIPFI